MILLLVKSVIFIIENESERSVKFSYLLLGITLILGAIMLQLSLVFNTFLLAMKIIAFRTAVFALF